MDAIERADWAEYIAEANGQSIEAKALVNQRVIEAREAGVSWNTIAEAVGISRQAANERFAKVCEAAGVL